VLATLP